MTEPVYAAVAPVFLINDKLAPDLARDCQRLVIEEGVEGLRTLEAHFIAVGAGATGPGTQMLHLDGSHRLRQGHKGSGRSRTVHRRNVFDGTLSAVEVSSPRPSRRWWPAAPRTR